MALDIGQLLGSYSTATKALLAAAGLPQQLYGDAPAVPSQATPDTGGAPAPAAAQAVGATSPETAAQFLAAAAKYRGAHKGAGGLLGFADAQGSPAAFGRRTQGRLVTNPGAASPADAVSTLITHGQHAGQRAQTFDLGGGRTAHVYVDPVTGKRSVQVF